MVQLFSMVLKQTVSYAFLHEEFSNPVNLQSDFRRK